MGTVEESHLQVTLFLHSTPLHIEAGFVEGEDFLESFIRIDGEQMIRFADCNELIIIAEAFFVLGFLTPREPGDDPVDQRVAEYIRVV